MSHTKFIELYVKISHVLCGTILVFFPLPWSDIDQKQLWEPRTSLTLQFTAHREGKVLKAKTWR